MPEPTDAETPDPPQSPARRALVLAAKIVVSVGLLALLISSSDVPRLWAYVRDGVSGGLGDGAGDCTC